MFRILHLSDLHARQSSRWSTDAILLSARNVLLRESAQVNFDVLAFTGDIAFSGKAEEYDIAAQWIEDVCLSPSGLNLDQERVLCVPGNHDVDRQHIGAAANAIEEALAAATCQNDIAHYYNDAESRRILFQRHHAYIAFCERLRGDTLLSSPSWTQRFDFGEYSVSFEGFCTSWLCRGEDDKGRLLVGQPQLTERMSNRQNSDLLIALMHHPLEDLMEFDGQNVQEHLRTHHHISLRGHLHRPDSVIRSTPTGGYLEIAAGALHEQFDAPNRFNIIDIDDNLAEVRIRTYLWSHNQWILDRNQYPDSPDGVHCVRLRGTPGDHLGSAMPSVEAPDVGITLPEPAHPGVLSSADDSAPLNEQREQSERANEYLKVFPRFHGDPRPEDLAIRQSQQEDALLLLEMRRQVAIYAEWGTNPTSFLRVLVRRIRQQHGTVDVFHARCGGASTGSELQAALAMQAQLSATSFGAMLRDSGRSVLILDDVRAEIESSDGSEPTVSDTIATFLDYCPELTVITVCEGLKPFGFDQSVCITLGPLDSADTREYMSAHRHTPVELDSIVDYDRVRKATGGLPMHIDTLMEALAYTDLNGALFDTFVPRPDNTSSLPERIALEISKLASAQDDVSSRAYSMLMALCVLEQGESLNLLRRIQPQSPLWPKHARMLEDLGLLDVVDSSLTRNDEFDRGGRRDKLLRVPRVVRDYVIRTMVPQLRRDLVFSACTLYFGSDWRVGALRVRSRPSSSSYATSAESCNEMGVIRLLLSESIDANPPCTTQEAMTVALKYVDHLHNKGLYGEGYEAARDVLGIADSIPSLFQCTTEIAEIHIIAGKCARMIGERAASVHLLNAALPDARASGVRSRIESVLISLALAHEGLGNKHEAIQSANEVIELAASNSSNYLQAKAIIAGFEDDEESRQRQLVALERRARNHRHFTVADNIALDLASKATNTDEVLRHLAAVRSRHEREYNYVRATIRRIETLLNAGRASEITDLDRHDLSVSYSLCHSQRLGGVFEWCHRVFWNYLESTGDHRALRQLFLHSSFMWRLKGDVESEVRYVRKLEGHQLQFEKHGGFFSALIRYCNARLRALLPNGGEVQ